MIGLLRGDLDWIVIKCLEKDRTHRYESADGLAADIRRFLKHEPIIARPPSRLYRFQKLVKRNKAAVGAGAVVALALALGFIFSTWQYIEKSKAYEKVVLSEREQNRLRSVAESARSGEAEQRLEAERSRANEARLRLEAQARSYAADMNLVQRALELNNFGRASDLLNRYRPKAGETDLRGWEWRYLWQQCRSDALFTLTDKYDWVNLVATSADGKWMAVGEQGKGGVAIWDLRRRREIARIPLRSSSVANFSRSKSLLAIGTATPQEGKLEFEIQLWDVESQKVISKFPIDGYCIGLEFRKTARPWSL